MKLGRSIGLAALGVLGVGLVAARPRDVLREREVARIRAHFDSVVTELESRDVESLRADAKSHRTALVAELRSYRNRGEFPHNYDFPGQAVPYFVDRETGTLCAVANLLAVSGRRDIVDRVARTNNNVWVASLVTDSAFTSWLDANGLTLAEAARIQVPYVQPVTKAEVARNVTFGVAAVTALSGSVITGLWNATGNSDGHRTKVTKLGLGMGMASSILGTALLTRSDFDPRIGQTALGIGAVSMGVSIHSMSTHSSIMAQRDAAARTVAEAKIEPTIDARGGTGARVGVSIGF
jgi:hypothetical protein